MRAVLMSAFGAPEVLHFGEVPTPQPGVGEARIRVTAVAVARTKDVSARAGRPPFADQIRELPHVLGTEHSGTVDAVGPGGDTGLVGQLVAVSAVVPCGKCLHCERRQEQACSTFRLIGVHRPGSYAQYCLAPLANVIPVPASTTDIEAASIAANGAVARAQLDAGSVAEGSTVLVVGAGGSLGSTVSALAAWRGARVIGIDRIGRSPDCLAGLPLHAQVDGEATDLEDRLRAIAGPDGIDCVVDNLGIEPVWSAYRPVVATLGRIIVSGAVAHDPLPMQLLPFYLHSQSLIGVRTGNRSDIARIWDDVRRGFRPPESHIHPMSWHDVAAAHHRVQEGRAGGQTVLTVD